MQRSGNSECKSLGTSVCKGLGTSECKGLRTSACKGLGTNIYLLKLIMTFWILNMWVLIFKPVYNTTTLNIKYAHCAAKNCNSYDLKILNDYYCGYTSSFKILINTWYEHTFLV